MTEPAVATAPEAKPISQITSVGEPPTGWSGDFWGGLAAMLVALPSAIAFGVTIYAPLGVKFGPQGAIAGILGTAVLGVVAAALGGTKRLITTPSAPAVAVLAAFAIEMTQQGKPAQVVLLMLALVAMVCGALQIAMGAIGLGWLIKYMPHPVVSGFQSGVGLIIIVSQVPALLGLPTGTHFWQGVLSPGLWKWESLLVGGVTAGVMLVWPKITRVVPAAVVSLLCGMGAYFAIAFGQRSLLVLAGNKFVIGRLATANMSFTQAMFSRWHALGTFDFRQADALIYPALTLAVLLSIDTLKTSVVLDTLTHTRHNSNRELVAQGVGNVLSTAVGGLPGSGQTGATLVNMTSGGTTQRSGIFEGVLALLAFLMMGNFIAWIPLAAVAGILIVVGWRMFDRHSLDLLKSKSTVLDFAVIVTVVVVAETVSLIAASGVGVALAIMLFLREQSGGAVVRRKSYGNERFSRQMRSAREMEVLEKHGNQTVIFELQGSLFFGTTDQLYTALEPELKQRKYVVIDMRRVQSVDFTAAHMLVQVEEMVAEHNGAVVFSHMPTRAPSGQDMAGYFKQVGLAREERHARIFPHLDEALEWVEDRVLESEHVERDQEICWDLRELELLRERKEETIAALEAAMEIRKYKAGETVFATGMAGDTVFIVRQGTVRILLPLAGHMPHHLSSFGRGEPFGEISFTDRAPRSADAVAFTDLEVYVLTREKFDALEKEHHKLALNVLEWLASVMAARLRRTDTELRFLKES